MEISLNPIPCDVLEQYLTVSFLSLGELIKHLTESSSSREINNTHDQKSPKNKAGSH
jgi:hypothetical protein